ncbi:MAG: pyridoxamine 5'-phosphate oxidase family protein [Cyanobacteriota bacterium]|nr:pyridoxamine 5'-phosphate oxidase family protein [Cyanobacteriota bacterium]
MTVCNTSAPHDGDKPDPKDPTACQSTPSWLSLVQRALHRNRSHPASRYLQLATVDAQGSPHNRTLVFRGFLPSTQQLRLATDSRSEKLEQIQHSSQAEICWYFTKTREQFRITGSIQPITANHPGRAEQAQRQQLWQELSSSGKLLWYWPQPKTEQADMSLYPQQLPDTANQPPETFVLLLLTPTAVDHLQLQGDGLYPQCRQLYWLKQGQWQTLKVNP